MKFRFSISRKLFASYLLAILLVSGSVGTYFYASAADSLFHQLQSRLSNSAALLSQALDATPLEAIRGPGDEKLPVYRETLGKLRAFRATNRDIAFLYIMRLEDGKPVFVVDSDDTDEQAPPGMVYDEDLPNLFKGFREPAVDNELNTDEWGTFLSGYAPLRNGDGHYLIGIDMRAGEVADKMRRLKISGWISLGCSILLALLFSRLLAGHFGRAIREVSARCREIAGGDLDRRLELATGDELDGLVEACNEMSRALSEARREQEAARAALERSHGELERKVEERTRELREAAERLKREMADRERLEFRVRQVQKMESIGMLAGGIAHDFNNLLMGILGYADLARTKVDPDSEAGAFLEQIRAGSLRASELTKQILAYTGRGKFVLEPADLNLLVTEMCGLTRASLFSQGGPVLELAGEPLWMKADSTQIRQVILNLLTNAAEASAGKGGRIVVRTGTTRWVGGEGRSARLFVAESLPDGEYLFLEVSDSGGGIPPEIVEKVFDPYFTTKNQGHGLGLAAVAGIVRGHQGGVLLENRPGSGTVFTVLFPRLPVRQEDTGRIPRPGVRVPPETGILVVDDEPDVRGVLEIMLYRLGARVWCAGGGREALDLYREHGAGINLVMLDMSMPDMDGVATFEKLREIDPGVRVLLMTGFHAKEAVKRFGEDAPVGFLQKPFDAGELQETLARALAR